MRLNTRDFLSATAIIFVLAIPAWAQHKHTQNGQNKAGMTGEMAKMMQSPHHQLMMAHMKSMTGFATTIRNQAAKPETLDVDFARAAVAELRHCVDAMEASHQTHMQSMPAEKQANMRIMMQKMDQDSSMLKDQVSALEADVNADRPNSKHVTAHSNALIQHLNMMSMMGARHEAGPKKMAMKM